MLRYKKLGVTLKNQAHNKINCIHVLIFQVNFIINLLVRAISDMLEHFLCQGQKKNMCVSYFIL